MSAATMAARATALPDYDEDVVRLFTIATMFWGVVGFAAGTFIAFQLAYPNPSNRHEKTAILASAAVAEQSNLSDGERAALARLRAAWDAPVRWGDLGLPVVDLRDLVERGVVRRPVMADVTSVEDAQTALDAVIETRENSARADWNVSAWAEGTPDPVFILAPYDFASLAQMEASWEMGRGPRSKARAGSSHTWPSTITPAPVSCRCTLTSARPRPWSSSRPALRTTQRWA